MQASTYAERDASSSRDRCTKMIQKSKITKINNWHKLSRCDKNHLSSPISDTISLHAYISPNDVRTSHLPCFSCVTCLASSSTPTKFPKIQISYSHTQTSAVSSAHTRRRHHDFFTSSSLDQARCNVTLSLSSSMTIHFQTSLFVGINESDSLKEANS